MAIPVGEPANSDVLHRRKGNDLPVAPFQHRGADRDLYRPKGKLVTPAPEIHGGAVIRRKCMSKAEAVQVGCQPEPRVVGVRLPQSPLGKKKCITVDCGGEEIWPP